MATTPTSDQTQEVPAEQFPILFVKENAIVFNEAAVTFPHDSEYIQQLISKSSRLLSGNLDMSDEKNIKKVSEHHKELCAAFSAMENRRKGLGEICRRGLKYIKGTSDKILDDLPAYKKKIFDLKQKEKLRIEREKREKAQKEAMRIEGITRQISDIRALPGKLIGKPSGEIQQAILKLQKDHYSFDEYEKQGNKAVLQASQALQTLHDSTLQQEKQQPQEVEDAQGNQAITAREMVIDIFEQAASYDSLIDDIIAGKVPHILWVD